MPSDMIGAEILEEVDYGRRNFRFIQGPMFCQFLMVDEINRASPRTQSALLQAMEERHVTVTGREHALPAPFHVLATQNPLELEGTYPLPEAQLDRFLLKIDMTYPAKEAEKKIIQSTLSGDDPVPKSVMYANDLRDFQQIVRKMHLSEEAIESILHLVRFARPETTSHDDVRTYVKWGPGPRASRALALAMRARALLMGRPEAGFEDMEALLIPVLSHRMALSYAARADGVGVKDVMTILSQNLRQF
jgi:MoxR-like ATPase